MSDKLKLESGATIKLVGKDNSASMKEMVPRDSGVGAPQLPVVGEGQRPWYDKSNGEVNKRLLATYTFKNNGLRYELELVRDLLKAYDAKCEAFERLENYTRSQQETVFELQQALIKIEEKCK